MNRQTAPTRLLGSMQAKLQEQEKEQHACIAIHHYHCDHLGTPLALTDQTGQVAWAVKLDPWGNVLQEYNPQGIHQAIRLPGQHHETTLVRHSDLTERIWKVSNLRPEASGV